MFRMERGLGEQVGKLTINDYTDDVIGDKVKVNFIQVPEAASEQAVRELLSYLA